MPTVRKPQPIAVAFGDLHLSLTAPACRADKDWLAVQAGYLKQLKELAGDLPILFAGDLFDRWNPPPELINFALEHLPDGMLSVPGQHDLSMHRIDLMHRSGYGVLVNAGKVIDLTGTGYPLNSIRPHIRFWGFGWEQNITPLGDRDDAKMNIAIIHRYCWAGESKYPDAPEEANVAGFKKALKGYDVAITGDNHIPWTAQAGNCNVFNCGSFLRRKSDEIQYHPSVGIIYSDGTIKRQKLDTSEDKFHDAPDDRPEVAIDMQEFIATLGELGEHGLNFREAVIQHLKKEDVDPAVKDIILTALEGDNRA